MPGATPSDAVTAYLDSLYDAYDGFDVSQTTVTVEADEFDAVAARGTVAEVRVRVRGSDGVLAITGGDEPTAPGGVVEGDLPLADAAADFVLEQTGVDCRIDGLERVTLTGLHCEATGEEVWELTALFFAVADSQSPTDGAAWCDQLPDHSKAF